MKIDQLQRNVLTLMLEDKEGKEISESLGLTIQEADQIMREFEAHLPHLFQGSKSIGSTFILPSRYPIISDFLKSESEDLF